MTNKAWEGKKCFHCHLTKKEVFSIFGTPDCEATGGKHCWGVPKIPHTSLDNDGLTKDQRRLLFLKEHEGWKEWSERGYSENENEGNQKWRELIRNERRWKRHKRTLKIRMSQPIPTALL